MFFEGYTAEQLVVMLVGAFIAFTQAFYPNFSILEWAKAKWKLADTQMELFAMAFFMLLAALASWATGALAGAEFTLQWILANAAIFKGIAKLAYEMLKQRNGSN